MPLRIIKEEVMPLTQIAPLGVSGYIILGLPVNEWIVIGTGVLIVCNLFFMGLRIKDRYYGSE